MKQPRTKDREVADSGIRRNVVWTPKDIIIYYIYYEEGT